MSSNPISEATLKERYESVLKLVKSGETITNACKILKITRVYFHEHLSEDQAKELKAEKMAYTKFRNSF